MQISQIAKFKVKTHFVRTGHIIMLTCIFLLSNVTINTKTLEEGENFIQ